MWNECEKFILQTGNIIVFSHACKLKPGHVLFHSWTLSRALPLTCAGFAQRMVKHLYDVMYSWCSISTKVWALLKNKDQFDIFAKNTHNIFEYITYNYLGIIRLSLTFLSKYIIILWQLIYMMWFLGSIYQGVWYANTLELKISKLLRKL